MSVSRIELRHLASFIECCDRPTLGAAARQIEVSASTLSAQLHALEINLGLELFHRRGRNLIPGGSAVWLYARAQRLLLAEEFLRLGTATVVPHNRIELHLDVACAGSVFGLTIVETIRAFHRIPGTPFVDLIFTHNDRPLSAMPPLPTSVSPSESSEILKLRHMIVSSESRTMPARLGTDEWAVICAGLGGAKVLPDTVMIPGLPEPLVTTIRQNPPEILRGRRLKPLDCRPQDICDLIHEMPDRGFVLPRAMVPLRLVGHSSVRLLPLVTDSALEIVRDGDREVPSLQDFLDALKERWAGLDSGAEPREFRPKLTVRQLRLFGLALRCGSLNTAARLAQVAAPVIPAQLGKLETGLSRKLLVRGHAGSEGTAFGKSIAPFCSGFVKAFDAILEERSKVAAEHNQSIRIGVPPSWGRDCLTTDQVADALSKFCIDHPHCRVEVIEGSRDLLHEGVRSGALNFALVGRADPQIGSVPVGNSEDVALIVNHRLRFQPADDHVSPTEIAGLPLIVAPEQLTMHRTFINQMRVLGAETAPVMRLGSIPLIVAMLRRMPLCSVLPTSVVQEELDAGVFNSFSLKHLIPRRRLWLIFSTERTLANVEKRLASKLKEAFGEAASDIGD